MSIRVSSNQMVYRYKQSLNDANERYDKYLENGDGNSLHRPSDDSVAYTKWMRYETSDTENASYTSNVKTGISWMNMSDSATNSMLDIMKRFKEKTVAAANDTNDTGDMQDIGKEMEAEIQQIVSLGNTQTGDRYIFSGQSDKVQPFTISEEKIDRGLTKTLDEAQRSYFSGANGVDTATNASTTQMLSLSGSDGNTYYLNTSDGNVYSKDFVDSGYKDRLAKDANAIVTPSTDRAGQLSGWSDGSVKVSKYFKNTGEIKTDANTTYDASGNPQVSAGSITVNGQTVDLTFDTVKQNIVSYSGDDRYISMVKKNGATEPTADTVNLTGSDLFGADIFDDANSGNATSGTAMLNEMYTVLAKTEADDHRWLVSDGQTISDQVHSQTDNMASKLGARSNLYTSVQTMLGNQDVVIQQDITDTSSTDVAELAIKLMEAQTVYNLSLSLGSRILPTSLADYLS